MAKPKILYVDHHSQMGGAERCLLSLFKYLDRSQFEPILASTGSSPLSKEAKTLGIQVEAISMDRLRGMSNPAIAVWRLRHGIRELRRLIAREDVAIIHSNVMRASIYAAGAAKLGRAKLIWHVRDIHREQMYMRLLSRTANKIIAVSNAVERSLPSTANPKTTVIYDGVELEEFDPKAARGNFREQLGIPSNALVFGGIAWIAPWKQQHLFLEAAAKVATEQEDAVFVLIGGLADERHADYYQRLQQLARQLPRGRVIFAGPVDDAVEAVGGIDVLVHTADAEPFGRVLIEAMALEKPVIAPQSGGPQEIVEHDRTGILVPAGDAAALAEAMLLLTRHRERMREMGVRGRKRVEENFDAKEQTRKVERVYDEILGS